MIIIDDADLPALTWTVWATARRARGVAVLPVSAVAARRHTGVAVPADVAQAAGRTAVAVLSRWTVWAALVRALGVAVLA